MAEDTDEESYDLVEGFGDRGYGLCDAAAMLEEPRSQWSLVLFGRDSTGFLDGEVLGGRLSRNMQIKLFVTFSALSGPPPPLLSSDGQAEGRAVNLRVDCSGYGWHICSPSTFLPTASSTQVQVSFCPVRTSRWRVTICRSEPATQGCLKSFLTPNFSRGATSKSFPLWRQCFAVLQLLCNLSTLLVRSGYAACLSDCVASSWPLVSTRLQQATSGPEGGEARRQARSCIWSHAVAQLVWDPLPLGC